jgi:hypothetical protein
MADDVRLSDIEDRFICSPDGKRGAEVRVSLGLLSGKPTSDGPGGGWAIL